MQTDLRGRDFIGDMDFSKEEIETVLEHYFDIEIAMDNEQLGSCQFTGTFHNPTLEEVLQVISVALDVNHSIQDGVYRFSGDGC